MVSYFTFIHKVPHSTAAETWISTNKLGLAMFASTVAVQLFNSVQ